MNKWIKEQKWYKKSDKSNFEYKKSDKSNFEYKKSDITDPSRILLPEKKLNEEEIVAALRQSIIAEEDAINLYNNFKNSIDDEKVKKIFEHTVEEEQKHVGEFQQMIEELIGEKETKFVEEGKKETKEHLKEEG